MRYLRLFSANVKIAGKFIGDIEFAPITVFCGSNASGKTMLLNFIFQNLFNEYFDDNFESNNFKKFLEKIRFHMMRIAKNIKWNIID